VSLELFRFQHLSELPGIEHAISTRAGGVSQGRFASLNISWNVGDEPEHVSENLRRLSDAVGTGTDRLFAAYQVHGNSVTLVEPDTESRPRCDILITASPERTLMLRYADCTPVLLADTQRRVIGAVHAGWRGSAVRASGAAVAAMEAAFATRPGDLLAGIGPSIGPCCYTVGQDVVDAFGDRPGLFADGKLDLWEANRQTLLEAGVPAENIEVAGICTQCQSDRFFSHRANGGVLAGRFAGIIRVC
jgi:purine-nucleoside/S-methyl-5'-thioadenosine phosphorylase / adenosine deaminase